MTTDEPKPKRGRGRPPEFTMPGRIDAPPEEVAKAFLRKPAIGPRFGMVTQGALA